MRAPTGYTHAIQVTGDYRRLIISGQVGMALDGSVPTSGEGQIAQALANLRAVLAANGMTVANIVKTTAFLIDRGLLAAYRQSRGAMFGDHAPRPPRCCSSPAWPTRAGWWRSRPKRWRNMDLIRRNTVGDAVRRAARPVS